MILPSRNRFALGLLPEGGQWTPARLHLDNFLNDCLFAPRFASPLIFPPLHFVIGTVKGGDASCISKSPVV